MKIIEIQALVPTTIMPSSMTEARARDRLANAN